MGNGITDTMAKKMGARVATNEGKSVSKVERCGKVITKFVTEPSKKEGLYKDMEQLNREYNENKTKIELSFKEKCDEVIINRNKKIDEILKSSAVEIASKDETERLEAEADVSITSGKQRKAVLDDAKAQVAKINESICKLDNVEKKKYHTKALAIAKEAVGTKDRIKEIVEAIGEIVGKAVYAVKNEPVKATIGTVLVAVGATVATGPVGVITAVGAVTAVYGVNTLWKCGPAHVTLKKLEQIRDYSEKAEKSE